MYRAKEDGAATGPGTYRMFDPEMDEAAQSALRLKAEMRNALPNGEFVAALPADRLRRDRPGHRLRGADALAPPRARLIRPGRVHSAGGKHRPDRANRRMGAARGVRRGDDLAGRRQGRGQPFAGAVPDAAHRRDRGQRARRSRGLTPSRLELEITESVLLDKTERNVRTLETVARARRARSRWTISAPAFSSLSYLRNFPFDKIKIDQSFVRSLSQDGRSLTIVSAIAGLGQSFGMTTIAEGVETEDQMECLIVKGCTEVQGRYYSRPVPASEVLAMIRRIDGEE